MPKGSRLASDKRDERRGGYYWKDGAQYVSVTKVLEVIAKPALMMWYGKEVWMAMSVDPTMSQAEALAMPYQKNSSAKDRGTAIHAIVEKFKNGMSLDKLIEGVPVELQGYAKAFMSWVEDNNVDVHEHERTIYSEMYGYAGTLDMIATIGGSNKRYIIDVKTGKDIYPEAFLQLSAYKQGLAEEEVRVDKLGVLLLGEDGTYKFAPGRDCLDLFLSAKNLWQGLNEGDIQRREEILSNRRKKKEA